MGCGDSKPVESNLVVHCRQRRDLIRAAVDHRYALASAHTDYFRALHFMGDSLHSFVHHELSVAASSSSSPPPSASPVFTIPSSRAKRKSAGTSSSSSSSITTFSRSSIGSGGSHLHLSEDSHLVLSDEEEGKGGGGGGKEPPFSSSFHHHQVSGVPTPNYHYMKHSSAAPSVVYEHSSSDDLYHRPISPSKPSSPLPPPPPPPEASGWDFLNPFGTYEMIYSSYRMGSVASSINSAEVREKEGIPELEDEMDQEFMKDAKKGKGKSTNSNGGASGWKQSGKGNSSNAPVLKENSVPEEKLGKSSPECIASRSSGKASRLKLIREEEELARKKSVTLDKETSFMTEKSGPSIGTALYVQGTRDVREVVEEVREQFKFAAGSGGEVAAVLEVGKLRYQPRNTVFGVMSSRILDSLSMLAYLHPLSNYSQLQSSSTSKTARASREDSGMSLGIKTGGISSTLEMLYAWENKLFQEVKVEENLRVIYDKQFELLRVMLQSGAGPDKIESTCASIRKLLVKIDVSIKSIETISTRIQKLRDEELQPQLIALVQGLVRIWNALLDCHQKQYKAIADIKTSNLRAKTSIGRNSVAKATKQLEQELQNWLSCFDNWIKTQRAYIEALNAWLLRFVDEEPEITADGVAPFSPGRLGAPSVFIICNDWYQAMTRSSEDDVKMALHDSAIILQKLQETQEKEKRQKMKVEHLFKDLAQRLGSPQKNGIHLHLDASDGKSVRFSEKGRASLDLMRTTLDAERDKHERLIKQVHEVASGSLRASYIPIFEALGCFTLEMLKAYEGVRLPSVGGGM